LKANRVALGTEEQKKKQRWARQQKTLLISDAREGEKEVRHGGENGDGFYRPKATGELILVGKRGGEIRNSLLSWKARGRLKENHLRKNHD